MYICKNQYERVMESLNLIKNDPWLAPFREAIEGRYQYVIDKD